MFETLETAQAMELAAKALDSTRHGILITDLRQPDAPVVYCNAGFLRLTGYAREEVLGRNCRFLQGPGTDEAALEQVRRALREERECHVTLKNYRKDGSAWWNELSICPVRDPEGRVTHYIGTQDDVTDRQEAEATLQASATRFRTLTDNSFDIISIITPTGANQYVSASVIRILGYQPQEMVGRSAFDLIHPDDHLPIRSAIEEMLERPDAFVSAQYRARHRDGSWRWIHSVGRNLLHQPDIDGLVINSRDITAEKRAEEQRRQAEEHLRWQTYHDALTGLPNRVLFHEQLTRILSGVTRREAGTAVLYLDLDSFKYVNDTLGHTAGDSLVLEVALRLGSCLRPEDTLVRMSGDEFAVLAPRLKQSEDGARIAQRLREALRPPFQINEREIFVTASIGVSMFPGDGVSVPDLLRHAETAMYWAKEAGGDAFHLYNSSMDLAAHERLTLEGGLRQALRQGEFALLYQPQVELTTGWMVGAEALVRWNHPKMGQVPPSKFIPLAEETGMILPLGEWVLREACAQAARWQRQSRPMRVAVNISARQFDQPGLVELVTQALDQTGLAPTLLDLELTESTIVKHPEQAIKTLYALRALGVRLSLDDFGTGYSALSSLRRFPLDVLKVDRSFIMEIAQRPEDQAVVRAVIALAHALGLETVTEGVETEEQRTTLQSLGCDMMQGYLHSRPMLPSLLEDLIQAQFDLVEA